MAIKDNRQFIAALEETGNVVRIQQEVDWDLEVGAIVRRVCETGSPAILCERVKDYPDGYRLFGAPLATLRRLAVALGLPADTPIREVYDIIDRRMSSPIKPVVIRREDAPCKENILLGEEVNLYQFPAPMIHDGDGGRYIATWHAVVTKDPDSDWVNWGMYRGMIHNRRSLGGLCLPNTDQWKFMQKYWSRGVPMPFAKAIGMDPLSSAMAMTSVPAGESEVDYAGGLMEEPIELVPCETNELMVPAHSEIVLEGEILPGVTVDEGPFSEFTGYRSAPRAPRIVYQVKAITYRNDPILTLSSMGLPIHEGCLVGAATKHREYKKRLVEAGIPVTDVCIPHEGAGFLLVVGVKPLYGSIAGQVGSVLGAQGRGVPGHIIVVDADVDPFNMNEVIHALATKCHPSRGVIIRDREPGIPLTPFLSREERKWGYGARVIFDCTWPVDWSRETETPPRASFQEDFPDIIKEKVLKNWATYGFPTTS